MVGGFFGVELMSALGNWNEALTSLASLSISSPDMAVNSLHQAGRSHSLALHHTQSAGLDMGSSNGGSSSLDISDDPCRKDATSALSSGRSPKSDSLSLDPVSP